MQTLPAMARQRGVQWDAWQALGLGADMLHWMISCGEDNPSTHLRFAHAPGPGGQRGAPGVVRCMLVEGGQLPERLVEMLGAPSD